MVSHAWCENAEDFLETCVRSCKETDVMFICALSLSQCDDGVGPSIVDQLGTTPEDSPFARVLRSIRLAGDRAGWRWRWRCVHAALPGTFLVLASLCLLLPV